MIQRWTEGIVFVALAVALHLAMFWAHSSETGQTAEGGVGGSSSVTMAGATAEIAEMIAEWNDAPKPDRAVDEMTPDEQDQPQDVTTDQMIAPVMTPPRDTPQTPETLPAVTPAIDAPTSTIIVPPSPAPMLQPPVTVKAPMTTAQPSTRAGLAVPTAPTEPTAPKLAAPQIEPALVEPPEPEVAANAPAAAPQPQKKPKPPKQEIAKAAPAKPKAPAKAKAAPEPQPTAKALAKNANQDVTDGASAEAAPTSVAAGAGDGAEAGNSQSVRATGLSANERANLEQVWGGKIRRSVERKKRYPRSTRRSGTTKIAMTVSRAGGLISVNVSKSSGNAKLDKAAMKAVKAAAPYASAPTELKDGPYKFFLNIRFER